MLRRLITSHKNIYNFSKWKIKKPIKITEVGPRDGLQNEKIFVATESKLELIDGLIQTGLRNIEVTGFVSPKWVPQLKDHEEICQKLEKRDDLVYSVIVPNIKGFQNATKNKQITQVSLIASASENFCKNNLNSTIADSFSHFHQLSLLAHQHNLRLRGYLSCVTGCPTGETINLDNTIKLVKQLLNMGCHEIDLADTIGQSTPEQIHYILSSMVKHVPIDSLVFHFHNTNGRALDNILTCLEYGINHFDSSVGGLGGCPYAKNATGNVSTEQIVELFNKNNIPLQDPINFQHLLSVSSKIRKLLNRPPPAVFPYPDL